MTNPNQLLDDAEEKLQLISDTFGDDDPKSIVANETYQKIISSGNAISYQLAKTYMEWCVAYPGRIDAPDTRKLKCRCLDGWVEKPNGFQPCPRCLPGAYSQWMKGFQTDEEEYEEDMDYNDSKYSQEQF